MTHRDYEYMKPSKMPEWMKDFAEKEAFDKKEGNYIDHINEILHPESKLTTVDAMVSDLRERVGLDMLTKEAAGEKILSEMKTAKNVIISLIAMANELDSRGRHNEAKAIDRKIQALAEKSKKKDDKSTEKSEKSEKSEEGEDGLAGIVDDPKFRGILEFIDKIVEGRGGKVTSVSIQAMIENEKGMIVDPEVQKYLENKIKAVRENSPDVEEHSGLFGVDIQEQDRDANNQMFHMPESNMS